MPLSPGEQLVSPPGAPPSPNTTHIVLRASPVPPGPSPIYYNCVLAPIAPGAAPVEPGEQMSTPPGAPPSPTNTYVVLESQPIPGPGPVQLWQANLQPL